uniref:ATP synthase complex subunit 8 n=1 Tax=Mesopodagrion tibetanum TaxID=1407349 RepID=A0A6C0R2Q9_9ODON|nr:ATP synthase F0 subunit 8 [Mesopodagrion tibetanum]
MPQMAPISWTILFIYFVMTLMVFLMMNYYLYTPQMKETQLTKIKLMKINWKW